MTLTNLSHLSVREWTSEERWSKRRTVVVRMVKTAVKTTILRRQAPGRTKILSRAVPTVQAHVIVITETTFETEVSLYKQN